MKINKKAQIGIMTVALAVLGLCLILVSNPNSPKDEFDEASTNNYLTSLEDKIEELLLQMEGIETVSVLITLENYGETVYARNDDADSTEYVLYSDEKSQNGLKLQEIYPTVRGIAVVCTNGNNITVQNRIISVLSSALGISSNRITVSG